MLMGFVASLAVTASEIFAPAAADPVGLTVTIDPGTIRGEISGDVLSFKGIPYAQPPVGDLRWRPPQLPVQPWADARDATNFGTICSQTPTMSSPGITGSEDCLTLNVWRPAEKTPDKPLPVMVFIHGGGYINGSSSQPMNTGSELAPREV